MTIAVSGLDSGQSMPPLIYTIHDSTGVEIRAETPATLVDGQVVVDITPDDTVILDQSNAEEARIVTIRVAEGTPGETNTEEIYYVKNLLFVS